MSMDTPSAWLQRHAHLIKPGGRVLDLAAGRGRNTRWLSAAGFQVDAVDRDEVALASMQGLPGVTLLQADLEQGAWPYAGQKFDGIVVCRYLHRPLLSTLGLSLAQSGVLIYETFMRGQERYGRPSSADFLLEPGELLACYGENFKVVSFEEGELGTQDQPAMLQRIVATNAD
ncbi:class I SAM-dependent methyltransferase [Methylobacillus glycogenes]|uniref:class I SAM-dependent methyltransferase n=1 Tax=Methylobacillus glycogenes TaxID=406 RepID=UPI0004720E74|nr:class I SAM-dependent methyltransferase [Methylobacillus glycogenes]